MSYDQPDAVAHSILRGPEEGKDPTVVDHTHACHVDNEITVAHQRESSGELPFEGRTSRGIDVSIDAEHDSIGRMLEPDLERASAYLHSSIPFPVSSISRQSLGQLSALANYCPICVFRLLTGNSPPSLPFPTIL